MPSLSLSPSSFIITPAEDRPGAHVAFAYDRERVERFRKSFPRARWREEERGWFVPGVNAARRIEAWMARECDALDRHADERGRDAFAFDPIESAYLRAGEELEVRTPYSRRVVEELRAVPFARWDPEERVWQVPFRSLAALRARWPAIEEAARYSEPEARRLRRAATPPEPASSTQVERRRHRYPVPVSDPPPFGVPVEVEAFGVVVFEESEGELVDRAAALAAFPHLAGGEGDHVWARWRPPTLEEAVEAWPARRPEPPHERARRGWWWPDRDALREARRRLRSQARAAQTRAERKAARKS